jgi:hypothetical protein
MECFRVLNLQLFLSRPVSLCITPMSRGYNAVFAQCQVHLACQSLTACCKLLDATELGMPTGSTSSYLGTTSQHHHASRFG